MEALKIADHQEANEYHDERPEDPWRRGFTFADVDDAEWFIEVYSDVALDKERWHLDEEVTPLSSAPHSGSEPGLRASGDIATSEGSLTKTSP